MKTLKEVGFEKMPTFGFSDECYGREIANCTQVLSFTKTTKEWAISSKPLNDRRIGRYEILGLTIEETEAILNRAKELFEA